MAGTLFGLPLSIQFDEAGRPAAGGLLYVYDANTSTPANTYADFALTSLNAWPLEADAAGRLPSFYVDDSSYRARLTTSGGIELFDEQSITSIGASSSSSGDSSSADTTTLLNTGDILFNLQTGTKSGFVRLNGRTMGSGSSGATERANSDTQALFESLWNALADAEAAVSSGRGGSATADFNANKTITLPDMRARAPFGLDDMGNSAASRIVGGSPTTPGTASGAETVTIATANLPSHTHGPGTLAGTTSSNGAHTHSIGADQGSQNAGTGNQRNECNSSSTTSSDGAHTHTMTITTGVTAAAGSGTATNKMPPYMLGTWYIKL